MNATLADTVAGLALTVILLAAFIVLVRGRAIRRRRRAGPLRSSAEQLVADFLVGHAALPTEAGPEERAALLDTAQGVHRPAARDRPAGPPAVTGFGP